MNTRIYVVQGLDTPEFGQEQYLVEAASAAQAIRHVVRKKFNAKVATTKEVAVLINQKVALEVAAVE